MKIEPNAPKQIEPEQPEQPESKATNDGAAVLKDTIERAAANSFEESIGAANYDEQTEKDEFLVKTVRDTMEDYHKERQTNWEKDRWPLLGSVWSVTSYSSAGGEVSSDVDPLNLIIKDGKILEADGLAEFRMGGKIASGGGMNLVFNYEDGNLNLPMVMVGTRHSQGVAGFLEAGVGIGQNTFVELGGGAFAGASSTLEGAVHAGKAGDAYSGVTAWLGFGAKSEFGAGFKDDRVFLDVGVGLAFIVGAEYDLALSFNPQHLGEAFNDFISNPPTPDSTSDWFEELGESMGSEFVKSLDEEGYRASEFVEDPVGTATEEAPEAAETALEILMAATGISLVQDAIDYWL